MLPFLGECFGNPSSAHVLGRASKSAVDKARMRVAKMLGCTTEEILFVASGSEADNHAIFGAVSLSVRQPVWSAMKKIMPTGYDSTYNTGHHLRNSMLKYASSYLGVIPKTST